MSGPYAELEFDLAGALRDRLSNMFISMDSATLERTTVDAAVPNEQGVYELFHGDELVYIGKTDADAGLRARLLRHAAKILDRVGLEPGAVSFKAIRLYVFTVMDLETGLLQAHRPAWNGRGFGSNDPGRERDTTRIRQENFDWRFPIDIHKLKLEAAQLAGEMTADDALSRIQELVPWKLRRQNRGGRRCHADLEASIVSLSGSASTPWELISEVVRQLPTGWQATALRSHVILYKETRPYPDPLEVSISL